MILGGVGRRKWSEKGRCNYILIKNKVTLLKEYDLQQDFEIKQSLCKL